MYLEFIKGVLNLDCGALGFMRSLSTPAHTKQKANKVPAEQIFVTKFISTKNIGTATKIPVKIVEKEGVLNFG